MYHYLNGILALAEISTAVIDCGGVGYKLTISENTYRQLPPVGTQTKLFTYLQVREDALDLFGFSTQEELNFFKLLITVSGVGAKVAMSVLSLLTLDKLILAIYSEDINTLAKANGLGKKTASRIILELKDKIAKDMKTSGQEIAASDINNMNKTNGDVIADAQKALMVLGYSKPEAISALSAVDTAGLTLEETITAALKKLMR